MLYGNVDGQKVKATPNAKGKCFQCGEDIVAKCGKINVWHWSHVNTPSSNHKPMTEWHYKWQDKFPKEMVEVTCENHRADVWDKENNVVYEFQHSPISIDEVKNRIDFWCDKKGQLLVWVVDAIDKDITGPYNGEQTHYIWKHMPKVWSMYKGPLFVDSRGDFNSASLLNVKSKFKSKSRYDCSGMILSVEKPTSSPQTYFKFDTDSAWYLA